jgi:4-amino-4-deoxy-L-arabinose transferase-like glycosyltransferase
MMLSMIAFLINLGLMPLYVDESIRSTVALEMMLSDNYVVPTLWGEFYYRKPPFHNWIITGFFRVFGFTEFALRLPSLISLFLLSISTWLVSRKYIGERAAILAGFFFMFSADILLRESFLGYIDPGFSLVTFWMFFAVYFFQKQKSYWKLYLTLYFLAAIGTLMKGLPSGLFVLLTLVPWLIYKKDWRALFYLPHFAGIGLFLVIVAGYFYVYSDYNSLQLYFENLYGQAAMRTPKDFPWYKSLYYFIVFPFENFGFLFPGSLFVFFAFRKGIFKTWLKDDFTAFVLICLAVNIIPYWLSPGYRPRYILMLYPLVFMLLLKAFVVYKEANPALYKKLERGFLALGIMAALSLFIPLYFDQLRNLWHYYPTLALLLVSFGFAFRLWQKKPPFRVYWFLLFAVLFRFAFSFYGLAYRLDDKDGMPLYRRNTAPIIAEYSNGHTVAVYSTAPIGLEYAFYLGREKNEVIEIHNEMQPDVFYLVSDRHLPSVKDKVELVYRLERSWGDYGISLVRPKQ